MKKALVAGVLCFLASAAWAQDYRAFRVGIGAGFANPPGKGEKGGVLVYVEPSYRITRAVAVGARLEVAVTERGTTLTSANNDVFNGNKHGTSSASLNVQYYFLHNGFRPFVGLGAGVYAFAAAHKYYTNINGSSSTNSSDVISGGSRGGFYPRIGFDASHFTFMIEYNIVPGNSTTTETTQTVVNGGDPQNTTTVASTKNSYLGIKIGFFLGGGRH